MAWLTTIFTNILTKFAAWALARALEYYNAKKEKEAAEQDIDKKLELVKKSFKKAFDGTPVTPEQREELKHAIREFIRPTSPGGM